MLRLNQFISRGYGLGVALLCLLGNPKEGMGQLPCTGVIKKTLPTQCASDVSINPNGALYEITDVNFKCKSILGSNGETHACDELLSPSDTITYTIVFEHITSGTTCTISSTVYVVQPPSISSIIPSSLEECGPTVLVNPTVKGTFSQLIWSSPSGEASPPFHLTASGTITISATNAPCGSTATKTLSCTVLSKPHFDPKLVTCTLPELVDCKRCLIDYPGSNAFKMDKGTVTSAHLNWTGVQNPLSSSVISPPLSGLYSAQVDSTNTCGTTTKTVNSTVYMPLRVKECDPSMTTQYTACPCSPVSLQINGSDCTLLPSETLIQFTPSLAIAYKKKTDHLIAFEVEPTKTTLGTLKIPFNLHCQNSSTKTQLAEKDISVTIKMDTCVEYSYMYCPGDTAILKITGNDTKKIKNVELLAPWNTLFKMVSNEDKLWIFYSKDTVLNPIPYSPLTFEVTYYLLECDAEVTYKKKVSLQDKGDCLPALSVMYRASVSTSYACIGDTLTLLVSENGPLYDLKEMKIPEYPYYSHYQDTRPGQSFHDKNKSQLAYRFISYKYYQSLSEKDTLYLDLVYKYRGTDSVDKRKMPLVVKSCPPNVMLPINQVGNLGDTISLTVTAENPTTDTSRSFVCNWILNPPRNMFLANIRKQAGLFQTLYYKSVPLGSTIYELNLTFNEGDSVRKLQLPASFIDTSKLELRCLRDTCCVGDSVTWELYTSNPKIKIKPHHIHWDGSPSPVHYLKSIGDSLHYFYAHIKETAPYVCYVDFLVPNVGSFPDTVIVRTDTAPPFLRKAIHTSFTSDTAFACQNSEVHLYDYVNWKHIALPGRGKILFGSDSVFSLSSSRKITAIAQAPYHCDYMDAADRYFDTLILIAEKDVYLYAPPDTSACQFDSILLNASSNGRMTWIAHKGPVTDTLSLNNTTSTAVAIWAQQEARIEIQAINSCPLHEIKQFKLQILDRPSITLVSPQYGCPYQKVDIEVTCTDCEPGTAIHKLYNKRTGQFLPTRGNIYVLQPKDSISLFYSVKNNNGCVGKDTMLLEAYPQPPLKIEPEGDTLCVPKGKNFTLTASGADEYIWSTEPAEPNPSITLIFNQDRGMRVIGTETIHGCKDTVDVFCAISLARSGGILLDTSACKKDSIFLEVEDLTPMKYKWVKTYPKPSLLYEKDTSNTLTVEIREADSSEILLYASRLGCYDTLKAILKMYPSPTAELVSNSPLCEGSDLHLEVKAHLSPEESIFASYLWINPLGDTVSRTSTFHRVEAKRLDTGTYRSFVCSRFCIDTASLYVHVDTHLFPSFAVKPFYCQNELDTFYAQPVIPHLAYHWFSSAPRDITTFDSIFELRCSLFDNTFLHLEVINGACLDTSRQMIHVKPTPSFVIPMVDKSACLNDSIRISPLVFLEEIQILWYKIRSQGDSLVNQERSWVVNPIDSSLDGLYYVKATLNGCESPSDTFKFTVFPLPKVSIEIPTPLCQGEYALLKAQSNAENTYLWNTFASGPSIRVQKEGWYWVVTTDLHSCKATDSVFLKVNSLPVFSLQPDTTLCKGSPLRIEGPKNSFAYYWSTGEHTPDIEVSQTGLYSLQVYDSTCYYSDSIFVKFAFCGKLHFPTAFTPNANKINDQWGPITTATAEDFIAYELAVFNRNGKRVFYTQDMNTHWDGNCQGQICPPGVYIFQCKYGEKMTGEHRAINGSVTLVQ